MPENQGKLTRFWQEIKRRKVFKVVAMYAGSAFVIIQVIDILTAPLGLPSWIMTLVVILLSIGFPIVAVLAWIFDLTPQGLKKTESLEELVGKEIVTAPGRRRLKSSDIVITVLAIAVIILAYREIFKRDALERMRSSGKEISVAVMPFRNMTTDTTWNTWQEGIQLSLISSLANTTELKVRQKESVKTLLQNQGLTEFASISPNIAGTVSKKLDADIYIFGTIQQAGSLLRLDAQLVDTKTSDILKSIEVDGPYKEEKIFEITDSLKKRVTDFLIISKLIKENPGLQHTFNPPKSADALRYFLYGTKATTFSEARNWYFKALAADSNMTWALFNIENTYAMENNAEQQVKWIIRNYNRRDQMSYADQLFATWTYAFNFEPPDAGIKYMKQLQELDDQDPSWPYLMGYTYNHFLEQYNKAIPELEKSLAITRKWGKEYLKNPGGYIELGRAYHKTNQYKKERKLYKEAEKYNPDNIYILFMQSILALAENDSITANRYIEKYISVKKENSSSEADIATSIAQIYSEAGMLDKAEEYNRKALSLDPENPMRLNVLAYFLIDKDRNISEGLELVEKALQLRPDAYNYLDTKGWGLYKQGKYKEALEFLEKSLERHKPFFSYAISLHLEEVKKAITGQKPL
jgi:tetratricopeptide (TPR) repeat protein